MSTSSKKNRRDNAAGKTRQPTQTTQKRASKKGSVESQEEFKKENHMHPYCRSSREQKCPEAVCTSERSRGIRGSVREEKPYRAIGTQAKNVVKGTHNANWGNAERTTGDFLEKTPGGRPGKKKGCCLHWEAENKAHSAGRAKKGG